VLEFVGVLVVLAIMVFFVMPLTSVMVSMGVQFGAVRNNAGAIFKTYILILLAFPIIFLYFLIFLAIEKVNDGTN